jgi:hypothetical protein
MTHRLTTFKQGVELAPGASGNPWSTNRQTRHARRHLDLASACCGHVIDKPRYRFTQCSQAPPFVGIEPS